MKAQYIKGVVRNGRIEIEDHNYEAFNDTAFPGKLPSGLPVLVEKREDGYHVMGVDVVTTLETLGKRNKLPRFALLLEMESESGELWETQEGWEKIVCQAVLDYPIAPREAKKILETFGRLSRDTGMSIDTLLDYAVNQPVFRIMA